MIDNATAKKAHDLIQAGRDDEAWPIVDDLLNKNPEDPKALYLAGWIMRQQGHVAVGLHLLRRAASIEHKVPNIWMHLGACYHDTHQYDTARECFQVVAKALPDDPMPIANIAASWIQQGKAREAVEYADKALAIDPTHRIGRIAKSFGELARGNWREGFAHSEALYGEVITQRIYCNPEEPTWDGSKGKTVVVQADQGLGDMVMFVQCLEQMAGDCKEVILETSERMVDLFRRSFPQITVYGTIGLLDNEWPSKHKIDAHIHISHLGKFYRKHDRDFPRKTYLTPDPGRCEKWRQWLEQYPRPWVGLAWRGGITRTNEVARSMALSEWRPIIDQGGTFVSLCYQPVEHEIELWNSGNNVLVHDMGINNAGSFDEWAALCNELDLVVSATTTIAHVRAALGKRVWVLVNEQPPWQHVYGGNGMVWYPESAWLNYRQKPGEKDWSFTINRVARDYGEWVAPRIK